MGFAGTSQADLESKTRFGAVLRKNLIWYRSAIRFASFS